MKTALKLSSSLNLDAAGTRRRGRLRHVAQPSSAASSPGVPPGVSWPTVLALAAGLSLLAAPNNAWAAENSPLMHSCCSACKESLVATNTAPAAAPLTATSLYQLDCTWTNDAGKTIKLGSLRGRPQIVAMFFARCTYACPLLVYQMQQVEAALPEAVRKQVGFVLVTFDTERDTPEALHEYRAQHSLAEDRWTLLRGNPEDVLELAALLNVKFKKDAQGQFLHSNVLTLLDAEGEIAYQQIGLNPERSELVERVEKLAGGELTVNRLISKPVNQ